MKSDCNSCCERLEFFPFLSCLRGTRKDERDYLLFRLSPKELIRATKLAGRIHLGNRRDGPNLSRSPSGSLSALKAFFSTSRFTHLIGVFGEPRKKTGAAKDTENSIGNFCCS